ncbi:hypothetical protein CFBP6600_23840 [Xanthomonas arboricola pv. corylina]|uniref:Uncharacterized protein n=1 Tax=Xanthomonas arboricola pv. corylina TaxID=487821 RepID=A0ABM8RZV8_9XANT|nr:hypothetical protein XAC301_23920 [Xanthomonas arboricola pv. corylina]CAE6780707.1 hypothetical protein XAC301_23920 [Xanthomonas arboricola pv. corylina]CAE6781094.1 hypothetical protein CFBP6600_23840 [Xanthomonas arboricola pv. corylina]CAE6781114.1 hypothetical protein CFBP6600_23840 [Xanthomonas arboricola pv. corylina]
MRVVPVYSALGDSGGSEVSPPSGETWAGRGLAPKAFKAWAKSAEGKAWAKAYPGAKFPSADGRVKKALAMVVKKASEPVSKAARKAVKKPAKKATKKA